MTTPDFPVAYRHRIALQLGDSAQAYFDAMDALPLRGLRQNPFKPPDIPLETLVDGLGETVPWAASARYLSMSSTAGAHALHEAGAYYIQEPSAMLPATLLAVKPGETVLDLCAAPGGKSTQLAAAMAGVGTLVCNEPVPSRAAILSRNLERMGVTNAVVVSMDPSRLAERWPLLFDAILVDAPCSGEGMFRRHPETRLEWDACAPSRCAARQLHICESALAMLKVGGRLCYSTCTFNEVENEHVIAALRKAHPALMPLPYSVSIGHGKALSAQDGQVRLYPHEIAGEGHFAALLQKTGATGTQACKPCYLLTPASAVAAPTAAQTDGYSAFCQTYAHGAMPTPNAALGEALLAAPPLPPLSGVKVLRAGLTLGQLKGKVFAPDHALSMAAPMPPLPTVSLDTAQAVRFQRGEVLPAPAGVRGYGIAAYRGLALGFFKASEGQLKNHYPKGLRRP